MDSQLTSLRQWTFSVFDLMRRLDLDYRLCFSGGKDSHVLLGLYLDWMAQRSVSLRIIVAFSDTFLETASLYGLIDRTEKLCYAHGIPFKRVNPEIDKTFWVLQFGLGYPVPNYKARWCTGFLKVKPMERKVHGVPVTGAHSGESSKRSGRLRDCGSAECGIDLINNAIEPISRWTNCDIWDWLILESDRILYPGCLDALQSAYDISDSEQGSLRMGCFMCPVVALKTIQANVDRGTVPQLAMEVRILLEKLRVAPRINSPRTKKKGAIFVDARISTWTELHPYISEMIEYGCITTAITHRVEELLSQRTYPPSYPKSWIAQQERLLSNPILD